MIDRKPLIAGNWKMYKTEAQAVESAQKLVRLVSGVQDVDVMIAPPFTTLSQVAKVINSSNIMLGAQNLFWENKGAFTGEISPLMLTAAGCRCVIIGHSERRQYFQETDRNVNKKIKAALQSDLIPIMCIGESESQREAKETFSVLDKQIQKGLEGFSSDDLKTLIIAYEPVWAIGTGKAATKDQAQEVHAFLRDLIEKSFGKLLAKSVRILYGGSVNPENVKGLMQLPDVDGALVGGASLDPDKFSKLVLF